jgi:hypothetical protein
VRSFFLFLFLLELIADFPSSVLIVYSFWGCNCSLLRGFRTSRTSSSHLPTWPELKDIFVNYGSSRRCWPDIYWHPGPWCVLFTLHPFFWWGLRLTWHFACSTPSTKDYQQRMGGSRQRACTRAKNEPYLRYVPPFSLCFACSLNRCLVGISSEGYKGKGFVTHK